MSARLLKRGLQSDGAALAAFTIPATAAMLTTRHHQAGHALLSQTVGKSSVAHHGITADAEASAEGMESAERETQELIKAAGIEAARLIAAAEARAARIEHEAAERGIAEARARIADELNTSVEDLRGQLTRSLAELGQLYSLIVTRTEHDLVRLSLEIARKIIHREVTTDPDITLTLVRVALARLHPRAVATVRLHPEDFSYVDSQLESSGTGCRIEMIADTTVGRGGCIVQSEHGDIDARIDQQFAIIERGFFEG
jgi:flagellar assembly protein FliH